MFQVVRECLEVVRRALGGGYRVLGEVMECLYSV